MRLIIEVAGRPAPQGSHELGGAGQLLDSSAYLPAWRQAIKVGAYRAYQAASITDGSVLHEGLFPLGTPVVIETCIFFVQDDQCRAEGTEQPLGKPDIDKLLRAALDALGGAKDWKRTARLFRDDSQVVAINGLAKRRATAERPPGALIIVSDGRD